MLLNYDNETYLYVHIPFCRAKCSYCSFYSVVSDNLKVKFADYMLREITLLSKRYSGARLRSIYFGGGTPSALGLEPISVIYRAIEKAFTLVNPESTIEVNPEDVDDDFAKGIKEIGFNRVSMGVQSSDDTTLKLLNRRADFNTVKTAFHSLRTAGFDNISLDLMYGLPESEFAMLRKSLDDVIALNPEHISIYCLTIDDKTVLKHRIDRGELRRKPIEEIEDEYSYLLSLLRKNAYIRYEISNFSKLCSLMA